MAHQLLKSGVKSSSLAFRSLSTSATKIENVTVIGCGLMGAGIAQVAAQAGNKVNLVDVNDTVLKKSEERIQKSVQRVAKKKFKDDSTKTQQFVDESLSRISYTTDLHKAVQNSDLVVEAIVENLKIKQDLFADIDKVAPEHTMFASNTSSIPISEIAELAKRKDRFGGLHFFNPVPVMKLLEVIRINQTSDATYEAMMAWGQKIGKVTVTCKDTPGFIVNRLFLPYKQEAMRLLERGDATARDIDTAMKLGASHPMGPFELSDYVGLDTELFVIEGWNKRFPDDPMFVPSKTVQKMVAEGKLGMKTGEGFYKYNV